MASTIEILIPTAEPKIKTIAVNSRLNDLNGKIVGFLWNEKPNGDILLQRIKDHLSQRFNLADTVWGQVEAVHIPAEDAPEVKQLGTKADAVVIATGD